MSTPDTPLPPPYNEISKSKSAALLKWSSPQPELTWYREQGCAVKTASDSYYPCQIVINDRTGESCIGSPERICNLLNEQIAKSPRALVRIGGSHHGSAKKKFGKQKDFDILIDADWLVAPDPSAMSPLSGIEISCKDDQKTVESVQASANWIHQDYGKTKV